MDSLVAALRDPACYPHAVDRVELVETHISWVLLAGDYAYKIKKPVRLAFLDFSTLEARRRFCEEELRLNRRTAPALYLDVVPVVQTAAGARIAGSGAAVEYAVRMRRFPADALADAMARRGALGAAEADTIAAALVRFHAAAPAAGAAEPYGTPDAIEAQALGNFDQIPESSARLARLRAWTARECRRLAPLFAARRAGGFVRECHGDLHLGNIAFVAGRALPFDCIEFDPALRWIDVMSEAAFLVMDLLAHRLDGLAWRALNAWLEATGDYDGVALLRFYLVYRAMVRAKIARLGGAHDAFGAYLDLADALAEEARPALVLMHGLSGSGKTSLSQGLLERLGAVRVRSDVERKRLAGLAPQARAGAAPGDGIYAPASTRRTYERLAAVAAGVLEAGYPAVVDAAFLRREQRDRLRRVAGSAGVAFAIVSCQAPEPVLRARIAMREAAAIDASDAGIAVLEGQFAALEALGEDEKLCTVAADAGDASATLDMRLLAALRALPSG